MSDKNAARAIAHDLSPRCTGGTGHGMDKDCPRYHSRSCENLTNRIAAAFERVRRGERERCFKIAVTENVTCWSVQDAQHQQYELGYRAAAQTIATAIRATPESEG